MAVNKVIYGGNTVIDLTGDTVTSDSLVEGVVAHDKSGASITGTNPYEKTATDTEVTSQADLIAQIQNALEGKAAGGGASVETCTVEVLSTKNPIAVVYVDPDTNNYVLWAPYEPGEYPSPFKTFNNSIVYVDSINATSTITGGERIIKSVYFVNPGAGKTCTIG